VSPSRGTVPAARPILQALTPVEPGRYGGAQPVLTTDETAHWPPAGSRVPNRLGVRRRQVVLSGGDGPPATG